MLVILFQHTDCDLVDLFSLSLSASSLTFPIYTIEKRPITKIIQTAVNPNPSEQLYQDRGRERNSPQAELLQAQKNTTANSLTHKESFLHPLFRSMNVMRCQYQIVIIISLLWRRAATLSISQRTLHLILIVSAR